MTKTQSIAQKYGCDIATAERFLDLVEEGHPRYQALVMAGLSDPPDTDYTEPAAAGQQPHSMTGADHGN